MLLENVILDLLLKLDGVSGRTGQTSQNPRDQLSGLELRNEPLRSGCAAQRASTKRLKPPKRRAVRSWLMAENNIRGHRMILPFIPTGKSMPKGA